MKHKAGHHTQANARYELIDGHVVEVGFADFPFDEVLARLDGERDETSQLASALAIALRWVCAGRGLRAVGVRAMTLQCVLDERSDGITSIMRACGLSKQAATTQRRKLEDQFRLRIAGSRSPDARKKKALPSKNGCINPNGCLHPPPIRNLLPSGNREAASPPTKFP